ncbi:MAG: CheR family methyltransferase [Myxococcota bacterium]
MERKGQHVFKARPTVAKVSFDEFLRQACPPLDLEWRRYRRRSARHRVQARMQQLGLSDYGDYLARVKSDSGEAAGLANLMRVTITRFFRERTMWESLAQVVLPRLVMELSEGTPLRAWSVGACGGEEPYSLVLLWSELSFGPPLELLATDIDEASLQRARGGRYRPATLREVPAELRARFFTRVGNFFEVDRAVKDQVRFERKDLLTDPTPRRVDLVLCRYLAFTYFTGKRRLRAEERLRGAMRTGGALMLGAKEHPPSGRLFAPWPGASGFFRALEGVD